MVVRRVLSAGATALFEAFLEGCDMCGRVYVHPATLKRIAGGNAADALGELVRRGLVRLGEPKGDLQEIVCIRRCGNGLVSFLR